MEFLPEEGDESGDLSERKGSDEFVRPKAPSWAEEALGYAETPSSLEVASGFEHMGWEAKARELVRIQAFESVRRRSFGREILKSYTQWSALNTMLEASCVEVALMRRLVVKKTRMEEAYGAALADFKEPAKLKKTNIGVACAKAATAAAERYALSKRLRGSMEALSAIEQKTNEIARAVREGGEAALGRASATARAVEWLFDRYVAAAAQIHAENRNGDLERSAVDMWLSDAQYRVGAAILESEWCGCSSKLSQLFRQAKIVEVERRKEIQLAERALLDACAATSKGYEVEHADLKTNDDFEADVADQLKDGAESIAAERRRDALGDRAAHSQDAEAQEEDVVLPAPLQSPLVLVAKLVLRRKDGAVLQSGKRWRRSLVVATADRHLHAFDIPDGLAVSAADDAFANVVNASTEEFLAAAHARAPKDPIKPSLSVDLEKSVCHFMPALTADAHLDLLETVTALGAKKILGKKHTRRIALKALSPNASATSSSAGPPGELRELAAHAAAAHLYPTQPPV